MIPKPGLLCLVLVCATGAARGVEPDPIPAGHSARYYVLAPDEHSKRLVADLRVTVLGEVETPSGPMVDWQMDAEILWGKDLRIPLAVRAVSERAPLTSTDGCGEFYRYLARIPDSPPFDYRHQLEDRAVLPAVAFRSLLLPRPDREPVFVDGFASSGTYLLHVIILDKVEPKAAIDPIANAKALKLNPELLVGTSRSVKDNGKGRANPTDNYTFIPLEEKDYRELIDAGTNYFGIETQQGQFLREQPVFYRELGRFPFDYYRSNFLGIPMFSDEPMVRLGWQEATPAELDHPQQMASFLTTRVRQIYTNMSPLTRIAQSLGQYNIRLDDTVEDVPLSPTWETEYQAAFYELAGGAPGIVHEGRYVREGMGWEPTALFGPGLEVSTREMLLCYYAFMRGAARAFDGDWGTSIYGQSDPAMREEALTLAYDMGARYLWFWTSDHDHHMVYPDQVALAKVIRDHAAAHPRASLDTLRRGAKVGIVFPAGYTLSWGHMWGVRSFSFETRNRTGTAYREVVAAALWEGVLCAKRGVPFDFTVDHAGLAKLGYEKLVYVGEDAAIRCVPDAFAADPARPDVAVTLGEARAVEERRRDDAVASMPAYGGRVRVDGDVSEWSSAKWIVQEGKASGTGAWDGPKDLTTRIAFGHDDRHLYIAAVVEDDVHSQPIYGWDLWQGDSVQIGFDPLNEDNRLGYSPNQHEIGLALLDDGRPIAWRWHCRRGQRPREMSGVKVSIRRDDRAGTTTYEAAVPLAELTPLSPALTPMAGVGVIFNDADQELREGFHETNPEALSLGKNPDLFTKLTFRMPAPAERDAGDGVGGAAGLIWGRTVAPVGGELSLRMLARVWRRGGLRVRATLEPCAPLVALPAEAEAMIQGADTISEREIVVKVDGPAGRYRLTIEVADGSGAPLTRDVQTVFIYPPEGVSPGRSSLAAGASEGSGRGGSSSASTSCAAATTDASASCKASLSGSRTWLAEKRPSARMAAMRTEGSVSRVASTSAGRVRGSARRPRDWAAAWRTSSASSRRALIRGSAARTSWMSPRAAAADLRMLRLQSLRASWMASRASPRSAITSSQEFMDMACRAR